jgi:hypothetical protein
VCRRDDPFSRGLVRRPQPAPNQREPVLQIDADAVGEGVQTEAPSDE